MKSLFNQFSKAAVCLTLFMASQAWAVDVDVVGAVTDAMPTGSPQPTGQLGYPGGGLILNFGLGSKVDLQVGALYLTRFYNDGNDQNFGMVQGLLGLNFKLLRFLNIDLGGYGNYFLANPEATSGIDYGVYGGLTLKVPLSMKVSFMVRGDYQYALNTLTYGSNTVVPSQALGLVGFSFGLGK